MPQSTLNQTGESPPGVGKGHGTGALGPSDSSDSGSDIAGNSGLDRQDGLPLDRGTTSDPDVDGAGATAGPDIGDADLDSDSDRHGTGERAAAGRDSSSVPVDKTFESIEGEDAGDLMVPEVPEQQARRIPSDDRPEQELEVTENLAPRDAGLPDDARSKHKAAR
jgi:hypothetical protein